MKGNERRRTVLALAKLVIQPATNGLIVNSAMEPVAQDEPRRLALLPFAIEERQQRQVARPSRSFRRFIGRLQVRPLARLVALVLDTDVRAQRCSRSRLLQRPSEERTVACVRRPVEAADLLARQPHERVAVLE